MKAPLRLCLLSLIVAPLWAVIPGGVEKIDDLGSKEVLAAARAAVCRLNEMSDSIYETLLVDVTDGTEQIVAGKKYALTIIVGQSTDCRKKDETRTTTDGCHISGASTWSTTVIYHPWYSPEYEVTSLEMAESGGREEEGENRPTHHLVGAPVPLEDTRDQFVLGAAETAVTELNKMSNAMYKSVLVEVVDGTSQVVNGIKYSMNLMVGVSECRNDGQPATLDQCPVELGTVKRWHAVVWQHPTQPPQYQVLDIKLS